MPSLVTSLINQVALGTNTVYSLMARSPSQPYLPSRYSTQPKTVAHSELPIVVLCIPQVLNPSLAHLPTQPRCSHSQLRCASASDLARILHTNLGAILTAKLSSPPCKLSQHRTAVLARTPDTYPLIASTMCDDNASSERADILKDVQRTSRTGHIVTGASI